MSGKDLVTNLLTDTKGFEDGIQHARDLAQHFGTEMQHFGKEFASSFFGGFGGFGAERLAEKSFESIKEGIEAGIETVRENIEAGAQLGHLSMRLGISPEDLQALQAEARHTGTDFEMVAVAIKKMDVNLGDALEGGKKARFFKELGLDLDQLADASQIGRFTAIGDAIAQLEDPASRVHLGSEVMGRSAAEALNVITKGAEGLDEEKRRLHELGFFSDGDIENLKQVHEQIEDLKYASGAFGRELTTELAPGLIELTRHMTEWAASAGVLIRTLPTLGRLAAHGPLADALAAQVPFGLGGLALHGLGFGAGTDIGELPPVEHQEPHRQPTSPSPEVEEARRRMQEQQEKDEAAELDRQLKEAQKIREQADPYEKYHREVGELMDNPLLSASEFGDALSRAAKEFTDEMEKRDPMKKLVEEADKLFDRAQSNADKFRDNVQEISDLFDKVGYTQEMKEMVLANEAKKLRDAEGVGDMDKQHQHEGHQFAGAYEARSSQAYSQLLHSTQPRADQYAKKQAELQQKSLDVENVIASTLQQIGAKLKPGQVMVIPP